MNKLFNGLLANYFPWLTFLAVWHTLSMWILWSRPLLGWKWASVCIRGTSGGADCEAVTGPQTLLLKIVVLCHEAHASDMFNRSHSNLKTCCCWKLCNSSRGKLVSLDIQVTLNISSLLFYKMIFTQWSQIEVSALQEFEAFSFPWLWTALTKRLVWCPDFRSNLEAIWSNLNFRKAAVRCCVTVLTELPCLLEMLRSLMSLTVQSSAAEPSAVPRQWHAADPLACEEWHWR